MIAGNGVGVSLVVGTLLNLINQGEYLLAGQGLMAGHALLNYLVPFCVACYSRSPGAADPRIGRECTALVLGMPGLSAYVTSLLARWRWRLGRLDDVG